MRWGLGILFINYLVRLYSNMVAIPTNSPRVRPLENLLFHRGRRRWKLYPKWWGWSLYSPPPITMQSTLADLHHFSLYKTSQIWILSNSQTSLIWTPKMRPGASIYTAAIMNFELDVLYICRQAQYYICMCTVVLVSFFAINIKQKH